MKNGLIHGSEFAPFPIDQGKVYGPYLELKDKRLLASTKGNLDNRDRLIVYFPGEGNYDADDPKVIVDYWGSPLRFYRRPYPPGALQSPYRVPGTGFTPGFANRILCEVDVTCCFTMACRYWRSILRAISAVRQWRILAPPCRLHGWVAPVY